jgi:hypothetical protein
VAGSVTLAELGRSPKDAINVEVLTGRGTDAYWVLRANGDCLVRTLLRGPESREISASELVQSVADTLVNLRRLYGNLGVTPRADLRIDIRLHALTELVFRPPNGRLSRKERTVSGKVSHIEEAVLGRIENDLVTLTRHFAEPLINAFEGSHLDDDTYNRIVDEVRASTS